jgi:O-antigen/teichoic acid export membrane protein
MKRAAGGRDPTSPDNPMQAGTTEAPSHAGSIATQRIARAFGQQLVSRFFGIAATVVTAALTTRHLGPETYGLLMTAVVFMSLWAGFTELGIGPTIVRRVSTGRGDLERLCRINFGFTIACCIPLVVVALVTGLYVYRDDPEVIGLLLIMSASVVLTCVPASLSVLFISRVQMGSVAVSDFVGRLVSLGATFVLVSVDGPLVWFAVVQLIPLLTNAIIQVVSATRVVSIRPIFARRESWDLFVESLPLTLARLNGVLYWRIDGIILSLLSTPAQVGFYGLAMSIGSTASIVSTFFGTATLSKATALYAENPEKFGSFTTRCIESMLFVGAPIAVLGLFVSHDLMGLVGGEAFVAEGGTTLAILLVSVAATLLNGVVGQALFAAHQQTFLLLTNVGTMLLNVVLNVAVAAQYGAIGAACALLASEVVGAVICSHRLSRKSAYRMPWVFALRLAVPLAAAAAAAYATGGLNLFITGAVGIAVYILTNMIVGPVTLTAMKNITRDREVPADEAEHTDAGSAGR